MYIKAGMIYYQKKRTFASNIKTIKNNAINKKFIR
jgi:hypothetical protein